MIGVPTIRLDSLTPDLVRAYVIADNRLAEKAGWDKSFLSIELQHLPSLDWVLISARCHHYRWDNVFLR